MSDESPERVWIYVKFERKGREATLRYRVYLDPKDQVLYLEAHDVSLSQKLGRAPVEAAAAGNDQAYAAAAHRLAEGPAVND